MPVNAEVNAIMVALQKLSPSRILMGLFLVAISAVAVYELQHIIADDAQVYASEINVSGRQRAL